jgi:RNA polymerase sigma-B factor
MDSKPSFAKYSRLRAELGTQHPVVREERNRLALKNHGLARKVAHRHVLGNVIPYEDLEQVAFLGLIKAIEGFDQAFGAEFSSYALPWIRGEVLHYIRDKHRWFTGTRRLTEKRRDVATDEQLRAATLTQTVASLDEVVFRDSGSTVTLGDTIISDQSECFSDEYSVVKAALNDFPPKHRDILLDFYVHDIPLNVLVKKYGYKSLSALSTTKQRAFHKLQRLLTSIRGRDPQP